MEDKVKLKFIQISDLHITAHRNLLEPMIESINLEDVDLVVVTGDTVNSRNNDLFDIAVAGLNKIKHRVVVVPGEYDGGDIWQTHFGNRYKSISLNGYSLEFLDTSYVRHRFFTGWGDTLKQEDSEQYQWLIDKLYKDNDYHIIFSHHPHSGLVGVTDKEEDFLGDNVRAVYSGHTHEVTKIYFRYKNPKGNFPNGFASTAMKFHGSSCYLIVIIKDNDEIIQIPRIINTKVTAW